MRPVHWKGFALLGGWAVTVFAWIAVASSSNWIDHFKYLVVGVAFGLTLVAWIVAEFHCETDRR